jgi:hypothetical protein
MGRRGPTRHRPDPNACLPYTSTPRLPLLAAPPAPRSQCPSSWPENETRRRDSYPLSFNAPPGSSYKNISPPLKATGKAIYREDTPRVMGPRPKKFYKQKMAKCEASGAIPDLFMWYPGLTLAPPHIVAP